jgi:hypothetical protein
LLWMYFPRNWEFGSALSKLRKFGGGEVFEHTTPLPLGTPMSLSSSLFVNSDYGNVSKNFLPILVLSSEFLYIVKTVISHSKKCLLD